MIDPALTLAGLAGACWRVVLDVELPLAPQPKERHRSARVPAKGQSRRGARGAAADGLLESWSPRRGRAADGDPYALHASPSAAAPAERIIQFTPAATRQWTAQAALVLGAHFRAAGHVQPPRHQPVRVDTIFFFAPPASPLHPVFHVVRPDRDNLDKIVLDALVKADVLADDAQVCAGAPLKVYAAGQSPGVRVVVSVLQEDTSCRS